MEIEKAIASILFGAERDTNILILSCQGELVTIHGKCLQTRSVIKADITRFPFKDNSFGIIILRGITGNLQQPIKEQKQTFQNILRILKLNGILYLGIENRLSPAFLLENRVSLINKHPKWRNINNIFNNFMHLILTIKYDQAYLFSARGYLDLLRKVGFKEVFCFGAPRHFNNPCVVCLERNVYSYFYTNLESPRRIIKEIPKLFFNIFGINRYFCKSYILTGRKREI